MKKQTRDQIIGALYIGCSFSLAIFCLIQSHRMGHDQRARDLASRSIHKETQTPEIAPRLIPLTKQIGEGSD